MDEVADLRSARGLTFRALAELAGTSPATLNAYERGRVSPTWLTFERIARSAGYEPVIDLVPSLGPVAYPIGSLVEDLAVEPEDERLRYILEFLDRWNETPSDRQRLLVHGDPGSTGDRHWDALVGGLAEDLCWHAGIPVPPWTGSPDRFLDHRWWPVDLPTFRVWALSDTPVGLSRRGVMLGRDFMDRA